MWPKNRTEYRHKSCNSCNSCNIQLTHLEQYPSQTFVLHWQCIRGSPLMRVVPEPKKTRWMKRICVSILWSQISESGIQVFSFHQGEVCRWKSRNERCLWVTEWHSLTHSVRKKATGTTSTACRANFELIKLIECDKYEIQYMYVKRKNQHFLEILPEA